MKRILLTIALLATPISTLAAGHSIQIINNTNCQCTINKSSPEHASCKLQASKATFYVSQSNSSAKGAQKITSTENSVKLKPGFIYAYLSNPTNSTQITTKNIKGTPVHLVVAYYESAGFVLSAPQELDPDICNSF